VFYKICVEMPRLARLPLVWGNCFTNWERLEFELVVAFPGQEQEFAQIRKVKGFSLCMGEKAFHAKAR
jgi:hypothetical protein